MNVFAICIHSQSILTLTSSFTFHSSYFSVCFKLKVQQVTWFPWEDLFLHQTLLFLKTWRTHWHKPEMFTKLEVRAVFWHSHELCIVSDASAVSQSEMWQDMNVASINQCYFDKLSTQKLNKWGSEAVLEKQNCVRWWRSLTSLIFIGTVDHHRRLHQPCILFTNLSISMRG